MNSKPWISEWKVFKNYFGDNRWYIAVYTGIFFLIYGAWLFNTNPRIDTEPVINIPFEIYGEYYDAAEPPVQCGESHLPGSTEPPIDSYSA